MRERFLIASFLIIPFLVSFVNAQGLGVQISDTQTKIKQLESEIASTEKELVKTEREKNTLSNNIKSLDLTKKKLEAETKVTENKVTITSNSIDDLADQIGAHTNEISKRTESIAGMIRNLQGALDATPIEIILSSDTISGKLDRMYSLTRLQDRVRADLEQLKLERTELSYNKKDLEEARQELLALKDQLSDKHRLTLDNISTKNKLLSDTKNKEANYKIQLEQKIIQKEQFEAELRAYEEKLKGIDISKLPTGGSGVLSWPLRNVTITQYFGNTEFAKAGAYKGSGHNGIDLRASVGTAVYSAGGGRVTSTGNTDLGCPGGSYGRWVLIDHSNGLSTIYAHLSLQKVDSGAIVERGNLIGYSGNSGYSTGPHLHFGVYATEGVKVIRLIKADGTLGKCPEMPVSPLNGYLNPLLYL